MNINEKRLMKKRFMNNSGSFVFKTKRALTPYKLERASYYFSILSYLATVRYFTINGND